MSVRRSLRILPYLFVGPALVLMFIILIAPIFIAGLLSFTDYSLGNSSFEWVGTENYEKIFTRSRYEKMLWATGLYVAVVVPLSLALGLGAALLINSLRWGGDLYKTIYFLPVMAALLAMAIVWEFALHPTIGIVNETLASLCHLEWLRAWAWYDNGCKDSFPLWLGEKEYALWAVCFIGIWQAFGFNMVLYLAGLTSIPRELYHAAEMDGAKSAWDRFRLVTWPMLGPTTVFVVTITAIRSFQVFDTVEAIFPNSGGPSKSVYVMMFVIYEKGIKENLIGMGAAITIVFLAFVLLMTLLQYRFVNRRTHYS
ncbi:MAG: sugar ABC transporter permease [Pseudomonadota bacterium]